MRARSVLSPVKGRVCPGTWLRQPYWSAARSNPKGAPRQEGDEQVRPVALGERGRSACESRRGLLLHAPDGVPLIAVRASTPFRAAGSRRAKGRLRVAWAAI